MKRSIMKAALGAVRVLIVFFTSCSQPGHDREIGSNARSAAVEDTIYGRLTGVNWFGFETGGYAPHGLWSRDYKSMLQQIYDLGFNCVRIPWSNEMLDKSPNGIQINPYGIDGYTGVMGMNSDLEGLSSIEVMDKIVEEAGRVGLKIILDNHSRSADGYLNETLWYTDSCSEEQWIADWVFLADRYKNSPQVIGADLNNEPHGNNGQGMKPPAGWGADQEGYPHTDWRAAAEKCGLAVLDANPQLLILVEGVEEVNGETYWWGGNLSGVEEFPITSFPQGHLVYSPHEYGPEVYVQSWFSAADFPANMPAIWDKFFWFIYQEDIAPLLFGEFGIKEESAADPTSTSYIWFTEFMKYVGYKSSWTFWCMNPNSGDTGGILQNDWLSVNTAKYNLIKPYLEPLTPGEEDTTAPAVPSDLSASNISSTGATLSWSAVSDSDLAGYNVYRGNSQANLTLVATPMTALWQNSGLSGETTYYYTVSAVDTSNNESAQSVMISLTTPAAEDDDGDDQTVESDLSLQLQSSDSSSITNTLGYKVRVNNQGDSAVDLSDVTLRYYFSGDNDAGFSFWCDYAGGPISSGWDSITSAVQGSFSDGYLEISFSNDAGLLKPEGYAEIQCRTTHDDWSSVDQSNDYSFTGSDNMADTSTMTVFLNGVLAGGTAP
ncbi:MAG: cellulase family glycosylhydrolase [Spirochaetaceae bacterium]|jgi:endoglucanase|nr:cellulase family glycosylhydrolase [Spirochaetaceae bacterium]